MSNPRLAAMHVIEALLKQQGSLRTQLPVAQARVAVNDRPLVAQLCFGTLRDFPRLEAIAADLLRKPMRSNDQDVYALLLLGLYQLRSMRTGDHAAINETVECCTTLNKGWAKAVLNGCLRNYQRSRDQIESKLENTLSFQYNHPEWWINKLKANWPEHWQAILMANDQPAPMTLRVNSQRSNRQAYLTTLEAAELSATTTALSTTGVQLAAPAGVDALPGFTEGVVSVQDEAAQLAVQLLTSHAGALGQGSRILDACSAPGGKLCHLGEHYPDASLDAVELSPERIGKIEENLSRLQLSARVMQGSAAQQTWWNGQPYQLILADVPCSASGVVRRNPDIKLNRAGDDINEISKLQSRIIDNLWQMLQPGGFMMYATCSIFPQENSKQIKRFLENHADSKLIDLSSHFEQSDNWLDTGTGIQLFPVNNGHDGFFYALLSKGSTNET